MESFLDCINSIDSPWADDMYEDAIDYVDVLKSSRNETTWLVEFTNGVQYLAIGFKMWDGSWQKLMLSEINWNTFRAWVD